MKKLICLLPFLSIFFICMGSVDAAPALADGEYKIKSAVSNNMVMTIEGGDFTKPSNVNLENDNNLKTQRWNVKHLGNDYYVISSSAASYAVLDVKGAGKINKTNVQIYGYNNSSAQKWLVKYAGNGYYYVISNCNNLYLDVDGAKNYNGVNLHMYQGNGTSAQMFKFVPIVDPKQSLPDGSYTISTALNNNSVLDLTSGRTENSTNVQLYSSNDSWAQIWDVKYLNNGYYSITSHLNSEKSLDVSGAKSMNSANVQLYQSNGTDAQQWILKDLGNGYYNIVSKLDNLFLDISGAKYTNGTNVQLYHTNGTSAQKFKFNKVEFNMLSDGLYMINSALNSNKVVGLDKEVSVNNANVQLETNANLNSQKWWVKYIGSGYYTIQTALDDSKAIDVPGAKTYDGANVQLYASNGSKAQKWIIKYLGGNQYSIVSALDGRHVDVKSGQTTEGTNIQLYSSNGTNAQKFTFTPTEKSGQGHSYEDGYYTISTSINTSMVLDVSAGAKYNGVNVQLYKSNNSNAQVWYLKYLNNGFYSIASSINPDFVLDVASGGMVSGTNVQMYRFNNSDSQQWMIRDLGDGNVSLVSKIKGLSLDVANGTLVNGANIQVANSNGGNGQKFKLSKNTNNKIYTGIDVSYHQGNIDWEKIAKSDLGFVIIRAGYGGDWNDQDDLMFAANVSACEKYNIPYGLYLYSYASDIDNANGTGAVSEAKHMLRLINLIKANNYHPNLGTKVFLDIEDKSVANVGKEKLTLVADKFCSTIENNGYSCGIYANKVWLTDKLDSVALSKKYEIWLAEWPNGVNTFAQAMNTRPTYNLTPYKYWQFASDGNINGISTNVDMDLGYNIFE